jgi:hypothetical protein
LHYSKFAYIASCNTLIIPGFGLAIKQLYYWQLSSAMLEGLGSFGAVIQ